MIEPPDAVELQNMILRLTRTDRSNSATESDHGTSEFHKITGSHGIELHEQLSTGAHRAIGFHQDKNSSRYREKQNFLSWCTYKSICCIPLEITLSFR